MINDLFVPAFRAPAGSPIRELFPYLSKPNMISFAGGYPSPSLFDSEGLQAAAQEVFSAPAAALQYGPTEGMLTLRKELLDMSQQRGVNSSLEQLLVTSGSQQAFDLLVRVFVEPGDTVLLEAPAYPAAIQALRLAGANLLEVPMDDNGLQTDHLESLLKRLTVEEKPKMLYTVPTFSNPRGSLLSHERRIKLIELARQHAFLIVEDDPYGELSFTSEVPPTIHELAAKCQAAAENPVVYLSSLSKTVAPALRVGWMVASQDIVRRCAIAKQTVDLCTSPISQLIAAAYLRSGRYAPCVEKARLEYRVRATVMADELEASLGKDVSFQRAPGGMFLWLECAAHVDPHRLFSAAVANNVLFVPGAAFFPSAPMRVAMRLSFAAPDVGEIREGVARLARAFQSSLLNL